MELVGASPVRRAASDAKHRSLPDALWPPYTKHSWHAISQSTLPAPAAVEGGVAHVDSFAACDGS